MRHLPANPLSLFLNEKSLSSIAYCIVNGELFVLHFIRRMGNWQSKIAAAAATSSHQLNRYNGMQCTHSALTNTRTQRQRTETLLVHSMHRMLRCTVPSYRVSIKTVIYLATCDCDRCNKAPIPYWTRFISRSTWWWLWRQCFASDANVIYNLPQNERIHNEKLALIKLSTEMAPSSLRCQLSPRSAAVESQRIVMTSPTSV